MCTGHAAQESAVYSGYFNTSLNAGALYEVLASEFSNACCSDKSPDYG